MESIVKTVEEAEKEQYEEKINNVLGDVVEMIFTNIDWIKLSESLSGLQKICEEYQAKFGKQDEEIKWQDIDKYVGEPVYDISKGRWRVLSGYQRLEEYYKLAFTDNDSWEERKKEQLDIYKNEVVYSEK